MDEGRKFYKKLMQKRLDENDILMYSSCNEGKSVVAKRFKRSLKGKIHKK